MKLADFSSAIAWVDGEGGGYIPSRAEIVGIDVVRRSCADARIEALSTAVVFDARFTFTHRVCSRAGGCFLLAR